MRGRSVEQNVIGNFGGDLNYELNLESSRFALV